MNSLHILVVDDIAQGCIGDKGFRGGVQKHSYDVAHVLVDLGHKVTMLQTIADPGIDPVFHSLGAKQIFLTLGARSKPQPQFVRATAWSYEARRQVKAILPVINPDIVINNTLPWVGKLAVEAGYPTLMPLHSSPEQQGGRPGSVSRTLTPAWRHTDIFRFGHVSWPNAQAWINYNRKHFTHIIPPVPDIEPLILEWPEAISRHTAPVKAGKGYVQVIGRAWKDKLPEVAAKCAIDAGLNVRVFTNVSPTHPEYAEQFIKPLAGGACDVIIDAPHKQVMASLEEADALVVAAPYESFGIVCVEAMERGVPIFFMKGHRAVQGDTIAPSLKKILDYPQKSKRDMTVALSKMQKFDRNFIASETRNWWSEDRFKKLMIARIDDMRKLIKTTR